ncbi:hypothetical protein MM213_19525 [Belliella sp. R4-6]|uniref:PH domain-containing protein n=1 Tax=Belliella alkalica TaxID=1730871 RepID=A0ABS9VGY1_9BACT|nr:hypothetical protein [Belliella alkalica]MCH7415700.1 hypothetical protein [Belliella alkalica]
MIFYYVLVILGGAFYISCIKYGVIKYEKVMLISFVVFMIFLIPQLILHINYYRQNNGDVFIYDPLDQRIVINTKGESASFSFNEIELIKRFKSYPLAENRIQWFPWDNYNYSIIQLKNGQQFIITSLLVPNMDLPIDSGKIKLKKSFYPILENK